MSPFVPVHFGISWDKGTNEDKGDKRGQTMSAIEWDCQRDARETVRGLESPGAVRGVKGRVLDVRGIRAGRLHEKGIVECRRGGEQ